MLLNSQHYSCKLDSNLCITAINVQAPMVLYDEPVKIIISGAPIVHATAP